MSIKERRKLERFVLKLPTWISFPGDCGNKKEIQLATSNINAGGAYLLTTQPLPIGMDVDLVLHLPLDHIVIEKRKHSQIKLNGKIVRADLQGMAILFNNRYRISPLD